MTPRRRPFGEWLSGTHWPPGFSCVETSRERLCHEGTPPFGESCLARTLDCCYALLGADGLWTCRCVAAATAAECDRIAAAPPLGDRAAVFVDHCPPQALWPPAGWGCTTTADGTCTCGLGETGESRCVRGPDWTGGCVADPAPPAAEVCQCAPHGTGLAAAVVDRCPP